MDDKDSLCLHAHNCYQKVDSTNQIQKVYSLNPW